MGDEVAEQAAALALARLDVGGERGSCGG